MGNSWTWARFDREVRRRESSLLKKLGEFPDAVLVAGCQRSGTTILTRVIRSRPGVVSFQIGKDDELDAALILSGRIRAPDHNGRFCFQTTYLNERYKEYLEHENYRLIWVVRNPYSAICSMLYNWRRSALNRLFRGCGVEFLTEDQRRHYDTFGPYAISRARKACLAYRSKAAQLVLLKQQLPRDRLLVVDYDQLISNIPKVVGHVLDFLDIEPLSGSDYGIHANSARKAERLSRRQRRLIKQLCQESYEKALSCVTPISTPQCRHESAASASATP